MTSTEKTTGLVVLTAVLLLFAGCDPERRQAIKDLRHPRDAVRAAAVARLVKVDGEAAIPRIGRLLSDRSVRVRRAVVRALRKTRSARAVPYLSTALRDPHPEVRLSAVRGLGELKRKEAVDPLLMRLADPKPVIRRAARFALEDLGIDAAKRRTLLARKEMNRCRSLVRTRTIQVRRNTAVRLGRSGLAEAVEPLIKLFRDPQPEVMEAAAEALGRVPSPRARKALLSGLKESAPEVRKAAARGLAVAVDSAPAPCGEEWVSDLVLKQHPALVEAVVIRLARCRKIGAANAPRPETLCAVLRTGSWDAARSAAVILKRTGATCTPPPTLTPLRKVYVAAVRGEPPASADLKAAAAVLRASPAPRELWGFLAKLKAPELHKSMFAFARGVYDRYLYETEKWLNERQWKNLEADPSARPLGPKSRPPADPRSRKLAKLLSRFPLRAEDEDLELLPPRIRIAAVRSALELAGTLPGSHKWLVRLAVEAPLPVRAAALNALALRPYPEKPSGPVVGAIRSALGGRAPLRQAAARALGRMGRYGLAMLSQILMRDRDLSVRAAAAESLARTGLAEARKSLRKALEKRLDLAVVRAIGTLQDPKAAPILLRRLKQNPTDAQLEERLALVETLGSMEQATSDLVSALLEELEHPRPEIRAAAARSLGRLKVRRARKVLEACGRDFFSDVRMACREALGRIEPSAGTPRQN